MKVMLESEDIQGIVIGVIEGLKPLLTTKVEGQVEAIILDVPMLCAYLNVTPKWIYERTCRKEIPYYKLSGKQLRFRKRDIDRWMDGLKTPVTQEYRGKLGTVKR